MNPLGRAIHHLRTQGMGRALRHRDYALFSLTSWISTIGMWMQRIGIGWLTWELTHSGAWLGVMAAANALPAVVLLPFTGAYADRIDRIKLMRVTQAVAFTFNALLAGLTLTGLITVEILLGITLITGIVQTFNMPARMTMAPSLVPRIDLPAAISVNSFLFTTAMFIGPALCGFVIEHGSVGIAFVANACSYLPFYIILYVIKLPDRGGRSGIETSILADVVDGVRYAMRHAGIGPVIGASIVLSILVRPLTDLVPGFIDAVFNAGPAALGMAMSAYGFGGMAGSLWMANRGRIDGTATIFLVMSFILAAMTVAFSLLTAVVAAVGVMAVLGFSNSASSNAAQTLVQGSVAASHRARVISLYSLHARAGPSLGALGIGSLSHAFGLQLPVGIAAGVGVLIVVWIWRKRAAIVAACEAPPQDDRAERPRDKAAE